jgi:hypothetical protein
LTPQTKFKLFAKREMQDDEPMNDDNGGEQQGSSHTPRRSSRRKVPKSQYSPEELQKEGESKERMISTLGEAWKEDELRKFVRSFDKRFDRQSWEIDWRDVAADVGNGRTEENVLSLFKAHQSFLLDSDLSIDEKADKFPQSHHDLFQNVQLLSLLSESPANEKKATPKKNSTPKRTPKVCVNCFTNFCREKQLLKTMSYEHLQLENLHEKDYRLVTMAMHLQNRSLVRQEE